MFPSKHLSATDLLISGQESHLCRITGVRMIELKNRDGETDHKPVISLQSASGQPMKSLVLNKTNTKRIISYYGGDGLTDDVTVLWNGAMIELHVEDVDAFGKTAKAIRVGDHRAAAAQKTREQELLERLRAFEQAQNGQAVQIPSIVGEIVD